MGIIDKFLRQFTSGKLRCPSLEGKEESLHFKSKIKRLSQKSLLEQITQKKKDNPPTQNRGGR